MVPHPREQVCKQAQASCFKEGAGERWRHSQRRQHPTLQSQHGLNIDSNSCCDQCQAAHHHTNALDPCKSWKGAESLIGNVRIVYLQQGRQRIPVPSLHAHRRCCPDCIRAEGPRLRAGRSLLDCL